MPNVTIHGPQTCPRPCAECDPGHHWFPCSLDASEEADPDLNHVLTYDQENGTDNSLAFYACKHCSAWLSDDDHDILEFGYDDAPEGA